MNEAAASGRGKLTLLLARGGMRRLIAWSTVIYAAIYLWAIGDLSFHGWRPQVDWLWTREPLAMLYKQRTLFYFEGIAIINLPVATYLFSPVNLIVGLALGALVGLNLASSRAVAKQKRGRSRPAGPLAASVLALLAGTACSAPIVLVLLGIQASAALLAFFSALVPLALVLLVAALVYNLSQTDRATLRPTG